METYRSLNRVVVIGGGTAGWLSALMFQRYLPNSQITLIESKEIGILGAGEGTTPRFINLLDFLGIPMSKLIKECHATLKNGIRFENWRGNNEHYYHNFDVVNPHLDVYNLHVEKVFNSYNPYTLLSIYNKIPNQEFDFLSILNEQNKSPYRFARTSNNSDAFFNYDSFSTHALHFDATELANFLKGIGLKRNIRVKEGIVSSFTTDEYEDISTVILESGEIVPVDFLVDCSGFARLVIGKHYGAQWKSHADHLPAKKAIPFFLPPSKKEELPPYTISRAMKYGWMWQIPLQHRWGCGYVFDSDFISADEAKQELDEHFNFDVESPRSFSFDAGYYTTPWVKNCVAIGLSSGFIEPLEATSIYVSAIQLTELLSNIEGLRSRNPYTTKRFNKLFSLINHQISEFLHLHYITDRNDTDFWKNFTVDSAPENVKNILELWSNSVPTYSEFLNHYLYSFKNWFPVVNGNGLLDSEKIRVVVELNKLNKYNNEFMDIRKRLVWQAEDCVSHGEFIEKLGGKIAP